MKQIFIFLLSGFFAFSGVSAQTSGAAAPGSPANARYVYGDLDKLGKLDLTVIYVQQIQKLNQLLPYCAFNQKGEATSLANMGVPGSKDNNGTVKKLDASIANHNEILLQTMSDIIPYSDKEEIIKAILFIQGIAERLEAGL